MIEPKNISPGEEKYEKFETIIVKKPWLYQYDYRAADGELFICIKEALDECRAARDAWLKKKGGE